MGSPVFFFLTVVFFAIGVFFHKATVFTMVGVLLIGGVYNLYRVFIVEELSAVIRGGIFFEFYLAVILLVGYGARFFWNALKEGKLREKILR